MIEKMYMEIIELLYKYMKDNKEIDNDFAETVVNIATRYLELEYYVRSIDIVNAPSNYSNRTPSGVYSRDSKMIRFYLQATVDFWKNISYKIYANDIEKKLLVYLTIIKNLLHEVEHANQSKKVDASTNDIETYLLKLSIMPTEASISKLCESIFFKDSGLSEDRMINAYNFIKSLLYMRLYQFAPEERLAEYYAYNAIFHILDLLNIKLLAGSQLNTNFPYVSQLQRTFYYDSLLQGYDKVASPTKYYLEQIGNTDFEIIDSKSQNLSMERKLSLGLEVDEDYLNDIKTIK